MTQRNPGPAFTVYIRYSEVAPEDERPEDIYWSLLERVPIRGAVGVAAYVNNLLSVEARNREVHEILNERFLRPDLRAAVERTALQPPAFPIVFNHVGCLLIMRDLILFGGRPAPVPDEDVKTFGGLALCANQFITSFEPPVGQPATALDTAVLFAPTWDLHNHEDLAHSLSRMFSILVDLLPSGDNIVNTKCAEIGIDPRTLTVSGMPVVDFVSIVFGVYSLIRKVNCEERRPAIFNHKHALDHVAMPQEILDAFMAQRSLTFAQFQERLMAGGRPNSRVQFIHELTERCFLTSDLNIFREFPLVRLDDEQAAVIDLQFLVELLTLGVYHSIFNGLFPERREAFRQMWGRLLELYAVDLLRHFYPPVSRVLSADVTYDRGQIDALLDFGSNVIVFEIKSALLREQAKRSFDRELFVADVTRKFVENERGRPKAVKQLSTSCRAIAAGTLRTAMQPSRIYPVFVTDEPAICTFGMNDYLNEIFQQEIRNVEGIRPLTTMSIGEFEEMLGYVSRGVFSWGELMDRRLRGTEVDTFSVHQAIYNLRTSRNLPVCRNDLILDRFQSVFQKIDERYRRP